MKTPKMQIMLLITLLAGGLVLGAVPRAQAGSPPVNTAPIIAQADTPNPPAQPVKLIFVHHSTGGMWLADDYGGLGLALRNNNYFVSATNYGWGPDGIGDRTDIPNWPEWFTGANRNTILSALYAETGQNVGDYGDWSRLATDPGGENKIIMFKSCFPNSNLYGNPSAPPLSEPNDQYTVENDTVENAKAVYNNILTYFATRPDKLFVVITAPPLVSGETSSTRAANARAFNNWLVNNWLAGYALRNVAVFDYYNVLTSNGGNANTNDAGQTGGNHHRWWNGAEQHQQWVNYNYTAYPSSTSDSHPSSAGQQKATAEFVTMLNVFYHRWQDSLNPAPALSLAAPNGGEHWPVNASRQIRWTTAGTVTLVNLYYAIDSITTTIETNVINSGVYTWTTPATATTQARVRVESVVSPTTVYDVSRTVFTLCEPDNCAYLFYLPVIFKNYSEGV